MKHKSITDEKLKALLNNMPEIHDKRSIEEIYEKVSYKVKDADRPLKRRKWMIPAYSAAAIFLFAVLFYTAKLIIPMGNESADQDHGFSSANDNSAESSIMSDEEESQEYGMENITPDSKEFSHYQLFGLEIGMPYLEFLNIMGEPSQMKENGNMKALAFENSDTGIELTLDETGEEIIEFTFYPSMLSNHKILSNLPKNKEETINFFGSMENKTSISCEENNVCEQYMYLMPNKERIIVTFTSEGEVNTILLTLN